jgi:hypothetical protein
MVVRTPVHGLLEAEVRASDSCDHTMFSHNSVPECSRITQFARRAVRSRSVTGRRLQIACPVVRYRGAEIWCRSRQEA